MRSPGGLILLTGIGVALFVYLPPLDSSISLERLQGTVGFGSIQPRDRVARVSRLGAFSPSVALSMPSQHGPRAADPRTSAAPAPRSKPAAIASDAQMGWQTTVSSAPPVAAELTPRDPNARYKLVLDIQQELRRAGCYWGRLDGSWGHVTKNAMKEFTDRVNATLPLDQPDYILLTLIQSHSHKVCGAAQTVAALTQEEQLPWKAKSLFKPVPTAVLPGRMAIGGPVPISVDAQQPPITPPAGAGVPTAETAALDPSAMEPPVTAAPKAERRSSGKRAKGNHNRRLLSGAVPRRARSSRRDGPGSPRHNLLLSMGGVY